MRVCMCLIVLCLLTFHYPASASPQTPKKNERTAEWEYKQLSQPVDEVLNHHAKEGWEIAAAAGGAGDGGFYKVILRRGKSHPLFGNPTTDFPKPEPPPPNSTCRLVMAQAPVIRGLRLGMTSDELFAIFPASEQEEFNRAQQLKGAELPPHYGFTTFDFNPSNHATKDRFLGIGQLSFGLLDKRVVWVRVSYIQAPQFERVGQLLEIITRQFGLPEHKDWPAYKEHSSHASLSCDGFTFRLIGHDGSFFIEVHEPTYIKTRQDRRQADLAKKRSGFTL